MIRTRLRSDHPVDELLTEWGAWVRSENRSGLGFAQVGYAEFIRTAQSTETAHFVNDRVIRLDEIIRKMLPPNAVQVLILRYVQMLPDKRAASLMRLSRSEFSKFRTMFVLPFLRKAWDDRMDVHQNACEDVRNPL